MMHGQNNIKLLFNPMELMHTSENIGSIYIRTREPVQ